MATTFREIKLRRVMQVIFVIYFVLLLRFTLFKYVTLTNLPDAFFMTEREANLIPFKSIYDMVKNFSMHSLVNNILGNILLFLPFGILWPSTTVFEGETTIYGCIASLLIEVAQYVFAMGMADIDDIILNTLGTFIGYKLIYCLMVKLFKERETLLTVMAVIMGTGAVAGTFLLYYSGYLVNGFPYYS